MSISSEITRISNAKATLKTKLNGINKSTDQITDETLDEYGDYVDTVSSNISTAISTLNTDLSGDSVYKMIAVGKGNNVTLTDTEEEPLDDFKILGRTVQDGTPSPSSPVAIENVGGKNVVYNNWAQDFVNRINNTSKAKLATYDNKNCVYWTASAGYNDYDNKYMFKINWKANTNYLISFDIYSSTQFINLDLYYTDGTQISPRTTANTWTHIEITSDPTKIIKDIRPHYYDGNCYINLDTFKVIEEYTVQIKRTDGTSEETYDFPLGNTPLMQGDYIDKLGVHHTRTQTTKSGSSVTLSDAKAYGAYVSTHKVAGNLANKTLSFDSSVTNAIIEYELATPTFTPLTSAQQTVFDEILQDGTYEVVTTYTGYGNLAPDMEINYHKDLQPRLSQTIEDVTDILG